MFNDEQLCRDVLLLILYWKHHQNKGKGEMAATLFSEQMPTGVAATLACQLSVKKRDRNGTCAVLWCALQSASLTPVISHRISLPVPLCTFLAILKRSRSCQENSFKFVLP